MPSPGDAAVAARDRALPGLRVLLDDDAVARLTGVPTVRRYLRYKPGTSCVLAATVQLPAGPADAFLTAYAPDGAAKADKTLGDAPPGTVLGADAELAVVAALAAADRDLPFLRLLADDRRRRRVLRRLLPDLGGAVRSASLTTLSYKPMRRWVGLLRTSRGTAVLRAYRPADAAAAAAVLRELATVRPRTPRLLGADLDVGVLALEYVDGEPLDVLLRAGKADRPGIVAAGRALAALHETELRRGLPVRSTVDEVDAVQAAAEQVATLLPGLAGDARRLADDVAARLRALPVVRSVVHGDFSPDQVVVAPDGSVAVLDLDRAAQGDPAGDLASLTAALAATAVAAPGLPADARLEGWLREGYAAVRPLPAQDALSVHAAALLLRRVVEPFRLCAPDWPDRSRALLAAAAAAADPLSVSPADLASRVVGDPVLLEVLKDKPGRRRTSRASGPGGTAIVKVYAGTRAPVVAARVAAVSHHGVEPVLPRVLLCDEPRHVVVLTEVLGRSFREALLEGATSDAARVGRALGSWHAAHRGVVPSVLRPHTVDRELATLTERAGAAPAAIARRVRAAARDLAAPWETPTVVHRDLYDEQIVLGELVGLLDLDDAAAGPGELDLGNLLAHVHLLGLRSGHDLEAAVDALLGGYVAVAPLDDALLDRCRRLSLLRLACLHRDARLLDAAEAQTGHVRSAGRAAHGRG